MSGETRRRLKSREYDASADCRKLMEADREIAASAGAADTYQLCETLHRTAQRFVPVDSCYVCLYSPTDGTLFFIYNFDDQAYDEPVTLPLGSGPTSWVVRNNAPFVLAEDTESTHHSGIGFGDRERVSRSAIHVPLRADTDNYPDAPPLGVFSVQSYHAGVYDEDTVRVIAWLAERAGAVLAQEGREAAWRDHLEAVEAKVAERKQQALVMADGFVQILKQVTREAEMLRPLLPPGDDALAAAVERLCRSCYRSQTEANQLPLRRRSEPAPSPVPVPAAPESLTEREAEILFLLASGASNADIAQRLYISIDTIKFHCKKLYAKLGVKNRTEAVQRLAYLSPDTDKLPERVAENYLAG